MSGVPADRDGFGVWVGPHLVVMGNLAARMVGLADRDDVVQDALTRAWRKRHTFDDARGSARSWLLAIVADRARRHRQRRRSSDELRTEHGRAVVVDIGGRIDVERAIATLPERMRLAVDCFYFVGLTVAETAAVMGVAEGTVKSTLSDARARLRTRLEVTT